MDFCPHTLAYLYCKGSCFWFNLKWPAYFYSYVKLHFLLWWARLVHISLDFLSSYYLISSPYVTSHNPYLLISDEHLWNLLQTSIRFCTLLLPSISFRIIPLHSTALWKPQAMGGLFKNLPEASRHAFLLHVYKPCRTDHWDLKSQFCLHNPSRAIYHFLCELVNSERNL
jgi:hypothetical protein